MKKANKQLIFLTTFLLAVLSTISCFAQPSAPSLTSATNVTATSFRINWNSVSGADGYVVDVSLNNSFSSFVHQNLNAGSSIGITINGLTPSTAYYYRARAYSYTSGSSGNSGTGNQTTLSGTPSTPTATSASAVTNVSFTANWSSSTGATSYLLYVSTSSAFTSFVSGYNGLSVTATSASVINLLENSTYYYRVKAVNSYGSSTNSNTISVLTLLGAPIVSGPSSVTNTSFTANWQPVTGAASYRLDVASTSNFSSILSGYNNLTVSGTSQSVTGLTSGTTYYYRVRAINSAGSSSVSSNVVTVLPLPAATTTLPPSSITTTSFVANWNAGTNASGYQLDVSADGFATMISGYNGVIVGGTSQTVTGLTANTTYYYRVRSTNSSGSSGNSNSQGLITLPAAPATNSASNLTSSSFQANWSGSTTQYQLDVSTASNFTTFLAGYNNLLLTSTNAIITGLSAGTTYYYRVRSVNASGSSSNSNTTSVLLTLSPPVASGATALTNVSFTANWGAVSQATSYLLDLSTSNTFASFVSGYNGLSVSGTSRSIINLAENTTYYYRVRATNGPSTSVNSNTISVLTLLGAPMVSGPSSVTNTSFTANWQPVTGAASYQLDVASTSNFLSILSGYNNLTVSGTSQSVTGLTGGTTYYYRVRALNSSGSSVNSNTVTVLPLPGTTTTLPPTNITTTSFVANWNAGTNASGYQLDVSADGFVTMISGYNGQIVGGTSQAVTGLAANTTYYYRVRSTNSSGSSGNSNSQGLITLPLAPIASIGTNITSTSFTANWNAGSIQYRLDVSTDNFSTFVPGYQNLQLTNVTAKNIAGLSGGTTYYYRVRAVNASGESANSNIISVLTKSLPPIATGSTEITATSFIANWTVMPNASGYELDVSTSSSFLNFVYQGVHTVEANYPVINVDVKTKTYYYRVRAKNSSGSSENSNVITVLAFPSVPLALESTNKTANSFTANWQLVPNASEYRIDVSTDRLFSSMVAGYGNMQVLGTSVNVNNLLLKTAYYYRVRSVNSSGISDHSNIILGVNYDKNYVRVIDVRVPGKVSPTAVESSTVTEVATSFGFFDGFGRPAQTISLQNSPNLKDVVQPIAYDSFGREKIKYLPYATLESDGWYKPNAIGSENYNGSEHNMFYANGTLDKIQDDTNPYSESVFEASPLNRMIKQGAPGLIWQPDGVKTYSSMDHTRKRDPEGNAAGEVLLLKYVYPSLTFPLGFVTISDSTFYPSNQLIKNKTKDEDQNEVQELVNKDGQVILKRVQVGATTYAETYYIYDDLGNLVVVLPPEATQDILNKVTGTAPIVTWANRIGVSVNPQNVITKTASNSYGNAAAVSVETLAAGLDGWVQMVANETNKSRMIGLTSTNADNGTNIQFALEFRNDGKIYVWESNVAGADIGQYSTGTVIRISRESSQIKYYVDGVYKQISSVASTSSMMVDLAIDHNGGTIGGVSISFSPNSVIQQALANFSFQYTYDDRKRMVTKQVPGSNPVYMVYDNRDRLVLTQDGNQRATAPFKWAFTKYDVLNRVILTGIKDTSASLTQSEMQAVVDTHYTKPGSQWGELYTDSGPIHGYSNKTYPIYTSAGIADPNHFLTVNYYDTYDFRDQWLDIYTYSDEGLSDTAHGVLYEQPNIESLKNIGQVTGEKLKVMDGGLRGGYSWLKTINYFDEKYRLVQSISDNYKGGQDKVTVLYDFSGKVLKSKVKHTTNEMSWTGLVNTIPSGNNLLKTTVSNGWSAGGITNQQLPPGVDGWIECIISEEDQSRAFGLTATNEGEHYTSIDYAFWHSPTVARFSENGSTVYTFPEMVKSGDVIRIERSGTDMNYYRNGQLLHTTHNVSTGKLVGDVSISNSLGNILMPRASFISKSDSINRRFVYDHAGRLTEVWHRINAQPEVRITYNQYNELGQLIDKRLHSTGSTAANAVQSVDYRYNIRGWLTDMNETDLSQGDTGDPTDYFNFQLAYETQQTALGNTPMFNGNISAMKWSSNLGISDEKMRAYKYSYDKMNRITGATFKSATGSPAALSWITPSDNSFSVTGYTYDLNGNIMSLTRKGKNGSDMDILSYNYGSGPDKSNQLVTVSDTGSKKEGFTEIDGEGNDYKYDNNGNLIWDKNKGGEEILKNGGFSQGSADWIITDAGGRLTFAEDSLSVIPHATASATIRQDDVILARSVYVVIVDVVREAGNILINIGNGGNTSIATTGKTIFTKEAGNGNDFVVTIPTTFSGHIRSIEVKGVVVISYNHLNLPEKIVKGLQQSLRYIYDASGRKISQEVYDQAGLIAKKSDYEGEFFYENDTLKFLNHEEGRVVTTGSESEYQYNLKDHLGNVRLTFTTKPDQEENLATLESANAAQEEGKFLNYAEAIKVNYNLFDHTYEGTTGPTYYSTRLTGGNTNAIYGLAKSLSVMPGDTINIEVYAKYLDPNSANWTPALAAFMAAVSGGTAPSGTVVDGGSPGSLGSNSFPFTGMFDHSSEDNIAPKAYLNFIVFDRDFDPIISESGYSRITTASRETGSNVAHDRLQRTELIIKEPGYVYVYLSNENETPVEVYFDDFSVEHIKSPVVQMDDYYPFGLTFNSFERENSVDQKYKFQNQEHLDELGLNWDQFKWRNHMPDIGRFFNVDPLAEKYVYNSPYAFSENKVTTHVELEGLEAFFIHGTTSSPGRWRENKNTIPTLMKLTNNRTHNADFKWNAPLNNNEKTRTAAARELATHVMSNRVKGEEITLIGHSHGGNVAIQASKLIQEQTGEKVNIITIATPAYNDKGDVENPETQKGSINDHIAIWNKIDGVSGGWAGDDNYTNSSVTTNAEVNVDQHYRYKQQVNAGRGETTEQVRYDAVGAHSFDVGHPEAIRNTKIRKLTPVENK